MLYAENYDGFFAPDKDDGWNKPWNFSITNLEWRLGEWIGSGLSFEPALVDEARIEIVAVNFHEEPIETLAESGLFAVYIRNQDSDLGENRYTTMHWSGSFTFPKESEAAGVRILIELNFKEGGYTTATPVNRYLYESSPARISMEAA